MYLYLCKPWKKKWCLQLQALVMCVSIHTWKPYCTNSMLEGKVRVPCCWIPLLQSIIVMSGGNAKWCHSSCKPTYWPLSEPTTLPSSASSGLTSKLHNLGPMCTYLKHSNSKLTASDCPNWGVTTISSGKNFPYDETTNNYKLLLLLQGSITQGVTYGATISDLLCVPIWLLIIPDSSTRALWQ
jgi:hypothetical protein